MTKLIPLIFAPKKTLPSKATHLILKDVCTSLSEACVLSSENKKIISVNKAFEKLTGFTEDKVEEKSINTIYKKKIPKSTASMLRKSIKKGKSFTTNTISYRHAKGNKLQVQTTILNIVISANELYTLHLLRDISAQKNREKNLKLSEGQYRFLFEKNPYPMWIFDRKTLGFLAVNDAAVHHYEYTRKEFLKMHLVDIRPKDDQEKFYQRIEEIGERQSTGKSGVWRHKKKNGEIIFVEISYTDISFNNQPATLIMANDITEKRLAEEAAGELNRRISHILDSITDAFISCDTNGKVTFINKQAEMLLQIKRKNMMGRILWKELPDVVSSELKKNVHEAMRINEVKKYDIRWASKKWIRAHIYPSKNGVSMYINDVTDEKEVSQRRDEFISIASHELKTPVTSIKAFSQLLSSHMKNTTDEKALYLLSKMGEQIDKLTQLLNDLLDVGRIQSGKLALRREQFNINELVRDTIATIQEVTKHRHIKIEGSVEQLVIGDKERIAEVLINLVTNAIKYSPQDKEITLRLEEHPNAVRVAVQDRGVGIPLDLQKKLFRRFYRINYAGTGAQGGLGLGLYIVRNIIKQHGGEVWVDSEAGKGSTFFFSLPL